MTSFKISKKPIHTDSRSSILEKHEKKIKEIEAKKEKIKIYKQEIDNLKLYDTPLNLQKIEFL